MFLVFFINACLVEQASLEADDTIRRLRYRNVLLCEELELLLNHSDAKLDEADITRARSVTEQVLSHLN